MSKPPEDYKALIERLRAIHAYMVEHAEDDSLTPEQVAKGTYASEAADALASQAEEISRMCEALRLAQVTLVNMGFAPDDAVLVKVRSALSTAEEISRLRRDLMLASPVTIIASDAGE